MYKTLIMAGAIAMFAPAAAYAEEPAKCDFPASTVSGEYTENMKRIDQRLDCIAKQLSRLDDMSAKIADLWERY